MKCTDSHDQPCAWHLISRSPHRRYRYLQVIRNNGLTDVSSHLPVFGPQPGRSQTRSRPYFGEHSQLGPRRLSPFVRPTGGGLPRDRRLVREDTPSRAYPAPQAVSAAVRGGRSDSKPDILWVGCEHLRSHCGDAASRALWSHHRHVVRRLHREEPVIGRWVLPSSILDPGLVHIHVQSWDRPKLGLWRGPER